MTTLPFDDDSACSTGRDVTKSVTLLYKDIVVAAHAQPELHLKGETLGVWNNIDTSRISYICNLFSLD